MKNLKSKSIQILSLTALMILGAQLLGAQSGDWPGWRGASHDGIASGTLNLGKLQEGTAPLWEKNIGRGYAAPSIAGNLLVILGNEAGKDVVRGLNAQTGEELWKFSYDCKPGEYPGTRASAALDGGFAYTLSRDGQLYCLDTANGNMVWSRNLVKEEGSRMPTWGIAGSVIVEGNALLVNANSSGISLDKKTGKTLWASPAGTPGYSSPVLFTYKGKKHMALFGDKALYAVDVATGAVAWKTGWVTDYDVNAADPLIIGQQVFISTGYDKGCALYDFSSGTPVEVWRNKNMVSHFSSFVHKDGYIYGMQGDTFKSAQGELRCLNLKTGAVVWSQNTGFGSLIQVKDQLAVVTDKGKFLVAELTPSGYREKLNFRAAKMVIWTAPVVANGYLYFRSDRGILTSYDVRS